MVITDGTIKQLRAAATADDPESARELGRLLSMLRSDSLERLMDPDFVLTWPEEQWLRTALRARPDDHIAAVLLAGRLVQQINYWKIDEDRAEEHGEDERSLARRRDEAHSLYTTVLQSVPDDPTAHAGIAALAAWADDDDVPDDPAYSYYELSLEMGSGSFTHSENVVTVDPDELRWACSWLVAPVLEEVGEPPYGVDLTLFLYSGGRIDRSIRLDEHLTATGVRWDSIVIPPLDGEPLPVGHPAGVRHYGYSCDWG
ncbi:hypothetical protein O4J56_29475 [Nocardiopsis sp. RSe5-2]|uniref:DUF4274 domain-containing protein n=1 Tax=Nocardiopsis endophytica TaxID=3018445 RepID=A0ABT4UEN7_9ACTN|nr:hypothetical protein [Nocardiopsis endophytica]MDA2814812.1 hypothetical protein [Nocardiopsis endophytica]